MTSHPCRPMSIRSRSALWFSTLAALAACDPAPPPPQEAAPPAEPAASAEIAPVTAPDVYRVRMETTRGPLIIEVHREWAPNGADRFYQLVDRGFYDGARFYRVIPGFMTQFGFSGDSATDATWSNRMLRDDPVVQSNKRGMVSFAQMGGIPNSRSTHAFINLVDNLFLDPQGFPPFGEVVEGMSAVDALYSGYGEGRPVGQGPSQDQIALQGNAYLEREFPQLDYIRTARIVK